MFVNFSNHPYEKWNENQLQAASKYGELEEVPFPQVPADASKKEIRVIIDESVEKIMLLKPDVVMCQGEFTVAFGVVKELQARGIRCVSACSERNSVEVVNPDNSISKNSIFVFCQFREYL